MRILVTGGLGSVGRPLVEELRNRGHDVWVGDRGHHSDPQYIRCDVGEYRQAEHMIETSRPDFVYHLAGEFGRMNGEHFYESLWKTNAVGTKNLLTLQQRLGFQMVFTSSSEIYGDYEGVMQEDVPLQTPIRQLNDYAISKWVNELQILNSADRFGTQTVRIRLFNIYGPGEYYSDYRSVVCLFTYRALHGIPYTVFTEHHRTYCYIDDAVRTIAAIVKDFRAGEAYNIGGEEYLSIKATSDLILGQLGLDDSLVSYESTELNNTLNKRSSVEKAKRDLGHRNLIPLDEGVAKTNAWQKAVYNR